MLILFIANIVKGERRYKSNLFEFVFSEPHPILSKYSER